MFKVDEGFDKATPQNLPRVDLEMLISCLSCYNNSAELRGVKAKRSIRPEYGDAAIGWVQVRRAGNQCAVKARMCPEHKVRQKGYQVMVLINEEEEKIEEVKCYDCAASLGGCKHAYAFAAWLHRRSEEASVTDTDCYWKKSKLSSVGNKLKGITLREMMSDKRKIDQQSESRSVLPTGCFFDRILSHGLKMDPFNHLVSFYAERDAVQQMSLHYLAANYNGDINNSEEFLQFCKERTSLEQCTAVAASTTEQSTSPIWHELRYARITASCLYEAAHCRTDRGALFERMMGGKIPDTAAMQRGRQLEKRVITVLETKIGEKILPDGFNMSPEYPGFGASPDGKTETYVIEVKSPSKISTVSQYYCNGLINPKFQAQMQLQMLLCQKEKAIFCIADPEFEKTNLIVFFHLNFDAEMVSSLMNDALIFWKSSIFPALMKSVTVARLNR